MAFRKNKKFIDPRYFMDEKTEIIKEEPMKEAHDPVGPGPSAGELMGRARENFPPDVLARAGYGEEEPEEEDDLEFSDAVDKLMDEIHNSEENPEDIMRRFLSDWAPSNEEPEEGL